MVHRKLAEFDGRSAVSTWLFGICINVARARRRARGVAQPAEPLPEDAQSHYRRRGSSADDGRICAPVVPLPGRPWDWRPTSLDELRDSSVARSRTLRAPQDLSIHARDDAELDAFRAGSVALVVGGAGAEALAIRGSHERERARLALQRALRQAGARAPVFERRDLETAPLDRSPALALR